MLLFLFLLPMLVPCVETVEQAYILCSTKKRPNKKGSKKASLHSFCVLILLHIPFSHIKLHIKKCSLHHRTPRAMCMLPRCRWPSTTRSWWTCSLPTAWSCPPRSCEKRRHGSPKAMDLCSSKPKTLLRLPFEGCQACWSVPVVFKYDWHIYRPAKILRSSAAVFLSARRSIIAPLSACRHPPWRLLCISNSNSTLRPHRSIRSSLLPCRCMCRLWFRIRRAWALPAAGWAAFRTCRMAPLDGKKKIHSPPYRALFSRIMKRNFLCVQSLCSVRLFVKNFTNFSLKCLLILSKGAFRLHTQFLKIILINIFLS